MDNIQRNLLTMGWEGTETLSRSYSFDVAGLTIRGTATIQVNDLHKDHIILRWKRDGEVTHPHETVAGTLCYARPHPPSDLSEELHAGWFAANLTRQPTDINLDNLANPLWRPCEVCGSRGNTSAHCRLEGAICPMCAKNCNNRHPGGIMRTSPMNNSGGATLGVVNFCTLVGLGVTGSWVLPVLLRTCREVVVYDNDEIDPMNPNGFWPRSGAVGAARSRITNKVDSQQTTRWPYVARARRFTERVITDPGSLLVLCPDSAQARLAAAHHEGPILDIRGTPAGIVVWAFHHDDPNAGDAWEKSLQGYEVPQACHHDNVPGQAGGLAAAFLWWWMAAGRPSGVWEIPYGFSGVRFNPGG